MKWDEFCSLLSGVSPESALGRIVQIRSENDPKMLKHFTNQQRKIRNEWRHRKLRSVTPATLAERDLFVEQWKNAFISMAK